MSRFSTAVAVVLALAATASAAAGPVGSCELQHDTAVGQYKLSTLDGLFGELLTTETNGNIYFVSICRPIPQSFYDPRKLAGAVKLTSDGHTIDLGHIDQTNVIVNEDTIVLTYVGGDQDRNPKDTCKGLRWKTYVVFACDVSATHDVLTLIDEDHDQPDVCQVWFEIKTSKTCVRNPHVPLDILDKELSRHYKQIFKEKSTKKMETYSNDSSINNKLSNNENSKLNTHHNFSKSELKPNNSLNASSDDKPFIYISPYHIIENKALNNEKEENDFHQKTSEDKVYDKKQTEISSESSEDELFIYTSPYPIIENKTLNNETKENDFHQKISVDKAYDKDKNYINSESSQDKPLIYTNPYSIIESKITNNEKEENNVHQKHSYKINYEDEPFINKNQHHIFANKTINNEKKEENSNQNAPKEKASSNKSYEGRTNNKFPDHENSQNNYPENKLSMNKNDKLDKYFKHDDHDISDLNVSNVNDNHEINYSDKNKNISHYKNKEYIKYQHKNIEDLPINNTNEVNKLKNNENRNENFHENVSNEENSSSEHIFEDQSSKNELSKNKNDKLDRYFKHDKHILDPNVSNVNDNHEINYSDKNKNISHYKNKEYIKYQHKNIEDLPINNTNEVNKLKNNENRNENFHENVSNEENSSSEHIFEDQSSKNELSKNKNDKLDRYFKHDKHILDPNVSNVNDNHEINYSDKNKNISHYKNKEYIKYQYKNIEDLPINNTNEVNKLKNNENRNENFHENISEGIFHNKEKHDFYKNNDKNEENSSSQLTFENQSSKNDVNNFSKIKERIDSENKSNTNLIPHNKLEEKSIQNVNENYSKGNIIDDHVIKSKNFFPSPHNKFEIKSPHDRDISSSENNTSDGYKFEDLNKNNSSNIYSKPIVDHNSITIGDIIKYRKNGSSHMPFDNYKNQSGEVENVSVKKHFDRLHNYNRTYDKSEFNGTFINQKYTKSLHTDQSKLEHHENPNDSSSSAHLPNNNNGDSSKSTNNVGLFGEIYSKFKNLYSEFFPNGIQLSTATILGGLGSITAVFGLIGAAINRFYYKQTGTNQIPFKGTFQCIYSYIKGFITKIFYCCGRNLEEPEETNEKTPLLHPKKIVAPSVEDETSRKDGKHRKSSDEDQRQKSKYSGDDGSSEHNNENQYGSWLHERISPTSDKSYGKKKRKSKKSSTSSSDSGPENESWLYQDKEKLIKAEQSLQEKSPKSEVVCTKSSTQNAQVIPPIKSIFEKVGENYGRNGKEKKQENVESVNSATSLEPQDVQSNIQFNIKKSNVSSEAASPNKKGEIINVSETKAEDDDNESVEVIEEIIYVDDGEDEEEIIEEIVETTTVEELPDTFDESDVEKSQSLTDSGERKGPTTVTVRTSVRKISSSSLPGEVKTIEETVVSDNSTKNVKKGFGIQLGIGKSGVNMSVGEKQLGIGRSGMKFGKRKEEEEKNEKEAMTIKLNKSGFKLHRNKNKSPVNTMDEEDGELDKQNLVSPEKNKKSKSKSTFKLFKRSISQPSVTDISEIDYNPLPDDTVKREVPSTSAAGLFKFGKSRSRSSELKKHTL